MEVLPSATGFRDSGRSSSFGLQDSIMGPDKEFSVLHDMLRMTGAAVNILRVRTI